MHNLSRLLQQRIPRLIATSHHGDDHQYPNNLLHYRNLLAAKIYNKFNNKPTDWYF
jgi:hypothetical protein